MELGNMLFGNSRGRYEVGDDNRIHAQLMRLAEAIGADSYFSPAFENDVFATRPYCWSDCDCGFDERWPAKEEAWTEAHPHAPDCYQTELMAREKEYGRASGYTSLDRAVFGGYHTLLAGMEVEVSEPEPGVQVIVGRSRTDAAMEEWREADRKREAFMSSLYDELCAKYHKPMRGCAIHCTCGVDKLWEAFASLDGHSPACCLELPNFHFKPTDFRLSWYKYPLRDSYSSEKLTLPLMRKVVNECLRSLGKNPEDY